VKLGEECYGGFFAGVINDGNLFNIIVSPLEGQGRFIYGDHSPNPMFQSLTSGDNITNLMLFGDHPGARFCRDLNIGGYTDWYFPALKELNLLYYLFKNKQLPDEHNLKNTKYFSSTLMNDKSTIQYFHSGRTGYCDLDKKCHIRAIRRFPVYDVK